VVRRFADPQTVAHRPGQRCRYPSVELQFSPLYLQRVRCAGSDVSTTGGIQHYTPAVIPHRRCGPRPTTRFPVASVVDSGLTYHHYLPGPPGHTSPPAVIPGPVDLFIPDARPLGAVHHTGSPATPAAKPRRTLRPFPHWFTRAYLHTELRASRDDFPFAWRVPYHTLMDDITSMPTLAFSAYALLRLRHDNRTDGLLAFIEPPTPPPPVPHTGSTAVCYSTHTPTRRHHAVVTGPCGYATTGRGCCSRYGRYHHHPPPYLPTNVSLPWVLLGFCSTRFSVLDIPNNAGPFGFLYPG